MSPQTLSTIAAIALSLAFSYIPGLSGWYERLDGIAKRLLMLIIVVCVAVGAFGLACAGWGADLGLELSCDQPGAIALLQSLVLALVANQSTYLITPKRSNST